jgi:hypothetical protein
MVENHFVTYSADIPVCQAGLTAFFGGAWTEPCPRPGRHAIGSPNAEPIRLCDEHYGEVEAAGLVQEPVISEAEYNRREASRTGSLPTTKPKRGWFGR